MSQSPGCSLGTAPGMMMELGVFDRGFDIYSGRVGTGDMVSTSFPSFSGDRARTPPKLKHNGTRDKGFNTSAG